MELATVTAVAQHVIDALSFGSLYALYALGVALIFGVMRLINFAQGEFIMAGAFAVFALRGAPLPVMLLASVVVAMCLALLVERVAFRPVRGAPDATLLVTSFAVSYLLQNVAALVYGSTPKTLNLAPGLNGGLNVGGLFVGKLDLVVIATTAAAVTLLHLFLTRTAIGIQVRAAAENFEMARLLGVSANRVIATAFAASGLLAGIASFLLLVQIGSAWPTMGVSPVLYAFVATVIGGMGSLLGAVLGGYLLGAVTVLTQVLLPYNVQPWRNAVVFGVVLAVLVFRPRGLLVTRSSVSRV